ncbi:MAG: CPBP family intramembrane glutamic endopeptidase [archaeon]|jgi:membrane protease YdiL (CAAX protease family)
MVEYFTYLLLALMVIFPFFWLKVIKKNSWEEIHKILFPKFQGVKKELVGSLMLFVFLVIAFFLIIGLVSILGINDLAKVDQVVKESVQNNALIYFVSLLPILFIEEFFFRAFLVSRIGVIPSTLLFTVAHFGYGSIAEFTGVFILGLILAYWFKKNKSLIQNYFGHVLYDLFAIGVYLFF